MAGLIPTFGSLLFTGIAFIVALSVIIAIHEYGHYIVGKWSGIRAEVFSIGFGRVLASRTGRDGTRWQIAALPFGGYVKFLGDASAASDRPDAATLAKLSPEDLRHTMHGAPLWARAATVFAGPAFNFVLSFLIFTGFALVVGVQKEPLTIEKITALPGGAGELRTQDTILRIDGRDVGTVEQFAKVVDDLAPRESLDFTVSRDGAELTVAGPWIRPPVSGGFSLDSAAEKAGMRKGDVIVAVDGRPIFDFEQLNAATRNSGGNALALQVWRDGTILDFDVTPRRDDALKADGTFETRYLIGMFSDQIFAFQSETPGPVEAVGIGVSRLTYIVTSSFKGFFNVISGDISTCAVSGPITIAKISGKSASQGPSEFIWLVAVISAAVGFFNLFPIPVLDGGHLVFHAFEAVTGRPPGDKALRIMMAFGLALLLFTMVFAFGNDIWCRFLR